jgi:MerR family transcriptional regulator, light-induced transcriptional regulator
MMTAQDPSPATLSIGDLARLSGMEVATLRTWESRYGFPVSARQGGGHRRYHPGDVALLAQVAQFRRTGLSVAAAIAAARRTATPAASSFFAHLRAQHPEVASQVLTKRVLCALTWAVEDDYCARAARPLLFGSFQREATYRRSEARWRELARTAAHTAVFADFDQVGEPSGQLVEVPLAADAPALREWTLVCDAPDYPACVSAWELPSATRLPDGARRFETVWSLDALVVREASRVGLALLAGSRPELARDLAEALPDVSLSASADLRNATTLFARMLAYAHYPPPLSR